MSALDERKARQKIKQILSSLGVSKTGMQSVNRLKGGKLYELYVLSELLLDLGKSYSFVFSDSTIAFKTSGGPIHSGDFHIDVVDADDEVIGQIYTDVEVRTLGWQVGTVTDLSQYHEIDVVVVKPDTTGNPTPDELLLGIECKATATFLKSHLREALGRRRELSWRTSSHPAPLHPNDYVWADPPSEYWLCYIDPAGNNYTQSPAVFSVELKHWQP